MRALPYHLCIANDYWNSNESQELVNVLISKKMPNGNFSAAMYMIDMSCLGLKNTTRKHGMTEDEFVETFGESVGNDLEEISVEDAHNLIFGAIDYAKESGFSPEPDWAITQYFLDEQYTSVAG